jgi:hypothetical protein
MERFVVAHTKNGLWSVSNQEQALFVHSTEEDALSSAFKLASGRTRAGQETVVVLEEAQDQVATGTGSGSHRSWHPRRRFT